MGKFDGFKGGRPGGFGGDGEFNLEQMEKETEEMLKMRFLDKKMPSLRRPAEDLYP